VSDFEYLEAVVFDMDGVIADTEAAGHRVAFNRAFEASAMDVHWDVDLYGELLEVSGGKERMRHYFRKYPGSVEVTDEMIIDLHKKKTAEFQKLIQSASISPRPGIARLLGELAGSSVPFALATTSNEIAARTLLVSLLGQEVHDAFDEILAGDVVKNKKPDPEIYHLAAARLGINPGRCVVIEDTRNGLLAAKAAGFLVCVTFSRYSQDEDFREADLVLSCIGDDEVPAEVLHGALSPVVPGKFTLSDFDRLVGARLA